MLPRLVLNLRLSWSDEIIGMYCMPSLAIIFQRTRQVDPRKGKFLLY
jgi:hypothetical protein